MAITTTPSGGPQGEFSTYTPISSIILSSTTTSVTLSNIPTTYDDLVLVFNGSFSGEDYLNIQFNGDTTASYSDLPLRADGSSVSTGAATNRSFIWTNAFASTGSRFTCRSNIQNYSKPNVYKTALNRADSLSKQVAVNVGTWRNTSPINAITLYALSGNNINIGSTFTLYGIKAAETQFIPTKAFGGDIIKTDGTYAYHVFKTTGTFSPQVSLTADVLMVSGGGGGSNSGGIGAGGGGGSVYYSTGNSLSTSTVITVGAGGARDNTSQGDGIAGSSSGFGGTTTSVSNGATGTLTNGGTETGGNGGASQKVISGSTTNYSGGTRSGSAPNRAGGGGAGAGANGAGANSGSNGGAGGAGLNAYASWATVTGTGADSGYFAGGGGGGFEYNGAASTSAGGVGGGGDGGAGTTFPFYNATNGVNNTGGGGGGCGGRSGIIGGLSGSGGSGIVIVRYPL